MPLNRNLRRKLPKALHKSKPDPRKAGRDPFAVAEKELEEEQMKETEVDKVDPAHPNRGKILKIN